MESVHAYLLVTLRSKLLAMKIGIVIAMDKEFQRIKQLLSGIEETQVGGKTFVTGTIGPNEIVLSQCGIGKVNAAVGAAELIDRFAPHAVISTGVAGGASIALETQEVVVSTEACYHDAYCGEEQQLGQIMGLPARFAANRQLLDKAKALDCGTKVTPGLIVTGDWFVDSREKMQSILDAFPDAMAVDMESAAIAHVCHLRGVPFISFRIISDIPLKDNKAAQYFDFWERMADNSFGVTKAFLESLQLQGDN